MTKRAPSFARAFTGRWRITEMDEWDEIDLAGSPHITFNGKDRGELAFLDAITCSIDRFSATCTRVSLHSATNRSGNRRTQRVDFAGPLNRCPATRSVNAAAMLPVGATGRRAGSGPRLVARRQHHARNHTAGADEAWTPSDGLITFAAPRGGQKGGCPQGKGAAPGGGATPDAAPHAGLARHA